MIPQVNCFLISTDNSLYIGGYFSSSFTSVNAKCAAKVVSTSSTASANVYPIAEIIGPGVLKSIANASTGTSIAFDGLTLLAGERLTLRLDPTNLQFTSSWSGRGNLMRYVVAGSDYGNFYLKPGTNNISIFMDSTTSASGAYIKWKPRFWGLDGALL